MALIKHADSVGSRASVIAAALPVKESTEGKFAEAITAAQGTLKHWQLLLPSHRSTLEIIDWDIKYLDRDVFGLLQVLEKRMQEVGLP